MKNVLYVLQYAKTPLGPKQIDLEAKSILQCISKPLNPLKKIFDSFYFTILVGSDIYSKYRMLIGLQNKNYSRELTWAQNRELSPLLSVELRVEFG